MYFDNIPEELKRINRWVCWKLVERDGRPTKIPINPVTGGQAMSNNPDTWSDYWTAHDKMVAESYSGIGFMFNGDGIVGVDIDHCRDTETGELTEQAKDIIGTLDSYTELSQSSTGIHIICRGKLPEGRRRKDPVEMYETGRYFCMTGHVLDDAHMDVEERTEQLAAIHAKYVNVQKSRKNSEKIDKNTNDLPVFMDDDKIIEIALNAKNGDLFEQLMNGNWKGRYQSQSEADIALCNLLAFYCRCDADQMQRLFRRSGLYREKWNERRGEAGTYGEITIKRAIADCSEVYTPPAPKKAREKHEDPPEIDQGLEHLGEPPPEQLPDWIYGPYNDMWNAQRLIEKHGENLKYDVMKGWYIYDGKVWREDTLKEIRGLADDAIMALYKYEPLIADERKRKELYKWLCGARNASKKDNMIREAEAVSGIASLPDWFDKDKYLINCSNGTLNLRTGKLRPHAKEDLITRILDVPYEPNAKAETWKKFLDRIFEGNKALISFIQRAIGYTLTGSTKEQCIFILYGTGKNGKSTFIETIRSMLGEYVRKVSDKVFTSKEYSYNSMGEIARLPGARMCTTDEPNEGARLEEGLVKQITGGAPLMAKRLYKEPFEFAPEFKLWMECNHKPVIKGTDVGIWRRIMLIPFRAFITAEEQDTDLPNKLLAELPGILAWAVKGCMAWQKDGLMPPDEVRAATDEYRVEMDNLQAFLDECVTVDKDSTVQSADLYRVYSSWCSENGLRAVSSAKLSRKLQERGFEKDRTKFARYWEGIKLSDTGKSFLHLKYEGRKSYEQVGFIDPADDLPKRWEDL